MCPAIRLRQRAKAPQCRRRQRREAVGIRNALRRSERQPCCQAREGHSRACDAARGALRPRKVRRLEGRAGGAKGHCDARRGAPASPSGAPVERAVAEQHRAARGSRHRPNALHSLRRGQACTQRVTAAQRSHCSAVVARVVARISVSWNKIQAAVVWARVRERHPRGGILWCAITSERPLHRKRNSQTRNFTRRAMCNAPAHLVAACRGAARSRRRPRRAQRAKPVRRRTARCRPRLQRAAAPPAAAWPTARRMQEGTMEASRQP